MAANNNNIFNAALSGAAAGIASRWLTSNASGDYASQAALINTFATAFDAAIPTQAGGGSRGQCLVTSDICAAFWNGRVIPADTNFPAAVGPLVALYQALAPDVLPDAGGGGGGSTVVTKQASLSTESSPNVTQLDDGTTPFTSLAVSAWVSVSWTNLESSNAVISAVVTFEMSIDGGATYTQTGDSVGITTENASTNPIQQIFAVVPALAESESGPATGAVLLRATLTDQSTGSSLANIEITAIGLFISG